MEADLKDLTNSVDSLERNFFELEELLHVLDFTNPYFEHVSYLFELGLFLGRTVNSYELNHHSLIKPSK